MRRVREVPGEAGANRDEETKRERDKDKNSTGTGTGMYSLGGEKIRGCEDMPGQGGKEGLLRLRAVSPPTPKAT